MQRQKILIYQDYGCSDLTFLEQTLRTHFEPLGHTVEFTDAAAILKNKALNDQVGLFVMPGGAATPYIKKLQTLGNTLIREYVAQGGHYLGVCAGAYYGCSQVEFEKDIEPLAIRRTEGLLSLIDAKAVGTLYHELVLRPFARNAASSTTVKLLWTDGQEHYAHYHGGSKFVGESKTFEVLARYADIDEQPPAIIAQTFGRGRVVLSGVHFEDRGVDLAKTLHILRLDNLQAAEVAKKLDAHETSREMLVQKIMHQFDR